MVAEVALSLLILKPRQATAGIQNEHTRNPVVTPGVSCTTLAASIRQALPPTAQSPVRRAVYQRFPPGRERDFWLAFPMRQLYGAANTSRQVSNPAAATIGWQPRKSDVFSMAFHRPCSVPV